MGQARAYKTLTFEDSLAILTKRVGQLVANTDAT